VIGGLFVLIALITLVFTDSAATAALGWFLVAVPFLVVAVLVPAARYRRWRYWVTDDRIELRHGLVFRVESSIPHFRVQHIDVRQGPLQRLAGVVELVISTASAATDATLPGLAPDRAEHIRQMVLAHAEADDAV
jgi:membrane protein YdbS with pleckstrin-like domain